jgi:hypothetical protein
MRSIHLAATAALVLCAFVSSARSNTQLFVGVEAPEPASARLYVFRPAFTSLLHAEAPALLANGREVAPLSQAAYTNLSLAPGAYTLSLKPGENESARWAATIKLRVKAGEIHFLAIWMHVEAHRSIRLSPFEPATSSLRAAGVRYEFVTEQQALDALAGLLYVAPAHVQYQASER